MDTEQEKNIMPYADEARESRSNTDARHEKKRRTAEHTHKHFNEMSGALDKILKGFASLKKHGAAPDAGKAHSQVEKLRELITERCYTGTDKILEGLGRTYVTDERFRESIDKFGEGTAEYISECIKSYYA